MVAVGVWSSDVDRFDCLFFFIVFDGFFGTTVGNFCGVFFLFIQKSQRTAAAAAAAAAGAGAGAAAAAAAVADEADSDSDVGVSCVHLFIYLFVLFICFYF